MGMQSFHQPSPYRIFQNVPSQLFSVEKAGGMWRLTTVDTADPTELLFCMRGVVLDLSLPPFSRCTICIICFWLTNASVDGAPIQLPRNIWSSNMLSCPDLHLNTLLSKSMYCRNYVFGWTGFFPRVLWLSGRQLSFENVWETAKRSGGFQSLSGRFLLA